MHQLHILTRIVCISTHSSVNGIKVKHVYMYIMLCNFGIKYVLWIYLFGRSLKKELTGILILSTFFSHEHLMQVNWIVLNFLYVSF